MGFAEHGEVAWSIGRTSSHAARFVPQNRRIKGNKQQRLVLPLLALATLVPAAIVNPIATASTTASGTVTRIE